MIRELANDFKENLMTIGTTEGTTAVLVALRKAVEGAGSQKAWCDHNGLSEGTISDVLRGRRDITDRVADLVGFERVTVYRPKRKAKA